MSHERVFRTATGQRITIMQGDITKSDTDAIVNAANERMLGGGGVDGAIHRAAGPGLLRACAAVPEVARGVRCPTGEARITPGFQLPARHVIHTVGPIYTSAAESAPLLAGAFRSSLELALKEGLRSVAFPGISTGVFGYPFEEAAEVSLTAVRDALAAAGPAASVTDVHFVLFGAPLHAVFVRKAAELGLREGEAEGEAEGAVEGPGAGAAGANARELKAEEEAQVAPEEVAMEEAPPGASAAAPTEAAEAAKPEPAKGAGAPAAEGTLEPLTGGGAAREAAAAEGVEAAVADAEAQPAEAEAGGAGGPAAGGRTEL